MKASTLAILLILYSTIGALLALATRDNVQYLVATITAVSLAFTLGASWPLDRRLTITGLAIGFAFALAFFCYVVFVVLTDDASWYARHSRWRFIVQGVFLAFAIFGGWTFVVTLGAGVGWLLRQLRGRRTVPEGQA